MPSRLILPATLIALIACGSPDAAPDATDSTTIDSATAAALVEEVVPTLGADTMAAFVKLRCADGGTWGATYWNGPGARVVLSSDSDGFTLPQQIAASGIRYADSSGQVEWWAKGDTATFTRRGSATSCVIDPSVAF